MGGGGGKGMGNRRGEGAYFEDEDAAQESEDHD